jgi:cytochrome P450
MPQPSAPFEPPGPPRRRFGAPPAAARRDPTAYLQSLARDYGDVARFQFIRRDAYLLSHPDLIRDVLLTHSRRFMKGEGLQRAKRLLGEGLLTSEADFHLKQRRLIQPVFLKNHLQNYAAAMGKHAHQTAARWNEAQTVDMTREMGRLTLAVVGETLFSADVEGEAAELGAALDKSIELFNSLNSPFAPLFDLLPFGPAKTFQNARRRLDATIFRLIEEHRQNEVKNGDLLSLLLSARYDDGTAMSNDRLRDEAMTIFLAGHETTANALSWTWVLLAQHPEIAARLGEEARRVLGDRPATYEDLDQLVFTRQVVSESLRLYPPAWVLGRTALDDYEIEHQNQKFTIPRGSLVLMSQWVMHRDARYWPAPDAFDPSRWDDENLDESRPKFAYFPFSAGPRNCIGEGFAWMEAILLLAGLAAHWRARLVDEKPIGVEPRITLRPARAIQMKLERW